LHQNWCIINLPLIYIHYHNTISIFFVAEFEQIDYISIMHKLHLKWFYKFVCPCSAWLCYFFAKKGKEKRGDDKHTCSCWPGHEGFLTWGWGRVLIGQKEVFNHFFLHLWFKYPVWAAYSPSEQLTIPPPPTSSLSRSWICFWEYIKPIDIMGFM
jgi:hypothetical protein